MLRILFPQAWMKITQSIYIFIYMLSLEWYPSKILGGKKKNQNTKIILKFEYNAKYLKEKENN
jgi:hypothetical protein